jgi:hypothetical protein
VFSVGAAPRLYNEELVVGLKALDAKANWLALNRQS